MKNLRTEQILKTISTLADAAAEMHKLWLQLDQQTDMQLADCYTLKDEFELVVNQLTEWHHKYRMATDPTLIEVEQFQQHTSECIGMMPMGGFKDQEFTKVKITVYGKTIELYDHAALIQGLMNALDDFKNEY